MVPEKLKKLLVSADCMLDIVASVPDQVHLKLENFDQVLTYSEVVAAHHHQSQKHMAHSKVLEISYH